MIFAQVTLATDRFVLLKKLKTLNKYESEGICIMFCPEHEATKSAVEEHRKNIEVIPTKAVWQWLCAAERKLYFDRFFKDF